MSKQECVPLAVEVQVKNFERSLKFYRDILGFKLIRQDFKEGKFAVFSFYKSIIMIAEMPKLRRPRGVGVQLRFILPGNLKGYHDRIVSRGAKVDRPIQKRYYGLKIFTLRDPDGFELKFATRG